MRFLLFIPWGVHTIVFFSHIFFCSLIISVVLMLELSGGFFFGFFYGCNQCSAALMYLVFKSLYRCVNAIFNTGKCFPAFFSWQILSVSVVSGMKGFMYCYEFSCSLVHLFKFFPRPLHIWSRLSYKENSKGAFPFDELLLYNLLTSNFLVLLRNFKFFLSFISTCLLLSASNILGYL